MDSETWFSRIGHKFELNRHIGLGWWRWLLLRIFVAISPPINLPRQVMQSPTVSIARPSAKAAATGTIWYGASALVLHLAIWGIILTIRNSLWMPSSIARSICGTLAIGQAFVLVSCIGEWSAVSRRRYLRRLSLVFSTLVSVVLVGIYLDKFLSIPVASGFQGLLALSVVWSLVPAIAWCATRIASRHIQVLRFETQPIVHPLPVISLRWLFVGMAAYSLLIGAGRAIPNHIMDTTPFVMLFSSVSLCIVGPTAIVLVPTWTALASYSHVTRLVIFVLTTLTFGLLVPFSFVMEWQAWVAFLLAVLYVSLLKLVTWLPVRHWGIRVVLNSDGARCVK